MPLLHLKAEDRVATPWRNGGGVTREVMAFPPGADLAGFDWRVSIADVADDGPFSLFPGIDRLMAVLSGVGVRLEIEGQGAIDVGPGDAPAAFAGDGRTTGVLIDGAIRDLNVMTRRGVVAASLERLHVNGGLDHAAAGPALLIWESGEASIGASGDWVVPAPLDAFYAGHAENWRIGGQGTFWLVVFDTR